MQKIKIAFFGCKPFGETCLEYLFASYSEKVQVNFICSNKEPNTWWKSNKCFELAKKNNIPFIDNFKRNESLILSELSKNQCDYLISIQHPWILSSSVIKQFKQAFNFHNAKLPEYKGHNCCNHAIINDDDVYTTTLHYLIPEVDSGDIILEGHIPIEKTETAFSLYQKSNKEAFRLFEILMTHIVNRLPLPSTPQTGEAQFYPRNSLDGFKNLTNCQDEKQIERVKRALYFPPFEGAYIIKNGKKELL